MKHLYKLYKKNICQNLHLLCNQKVNVIYNMDKIRYIKNYLIFLLKNYSKIK
jgi:hypothetical protein